MLKRWMRLMLGTGIGLAAAVVWLALMSPPPALGAPVAAPIVVNSVGDFPDAVPGDGRCETVISNSVCTLRAAIMEANARPGADVIQLQANTTYQLSQVGLDDTAKKGDLDITDSVSLLGAGPESTIIDGNGGLLGERVFQITSTVLISGVTIEHGRETQYFGGGLNNSGQLTLINTVIFSNTDVSPNGWGGGIFNSGALTISHSAIRDNATGKSNAYGGGIYNQGPLLITNSTISGNVTYPKYITSGVGYGGGLFTTFYLYTVTVVNSTFSGNRAAAGGGIFAAGSPLFLLNSTLSGNNSSGDGGGLYVSGGAASLFNVTVAGNQANSDNFGGGQGGGVAQAGSGTLTFLNSIIASNAKLITGHPFPLFALDDCAGTVGAQGFSLMETIESSYCTVNGSPLVADPLLGPLQNNGGPTLTQALLPGSPAIDSGNPGGCTDNVGATITADQRGRPRGARCDMGAYELGYLLNLPLVRR